MYYTKYYTVVRPLRANRLYFEIKKNLGLFWFYKYYLLIKQISMNNRNQKKIFNSNPAIMFSVKQSGIKSMTATKLLHQCKIFNILEKKLTRE
jgi:hypothetical protein